LTGSSVSQPNPGDSDSEDGHPSEGDSDESDIGDFDSPPDFEFVDERILSADHPPKYR
jgi:hypothetical protein